MHNMSNSFIPITRNYPFHIKIIKVGTNKYQYIPTNYSIIYDGIGDYFSDDIKLKGKAQDIPESALKGGKKYYVYLECTFTSQYKLSSATFKGSSSLLPLIDGQDSSDGFNQTFARILIAIIGEGGRICQNINHIVSTNLGILNGSPVVYLVSESSGGGYSDNS